MNNPATILLISHGRLAEEMYNTIRLITNEVEHIYFINFLSGMSFDTLKKVVDEFMEEHKKEPIVIMVDLMGGSCYNVCSGLIHKRNIKIFAGFNVGFLLEAIFLRKRFKLDRLVLELNKRKNNMLVYVNARIKT